MEPLYFETPAKFRAWLKRNHAEATELLVGFRKKGSGLASITWPESVDEALCFGWIDGVRKRVDESSYTIRFTPRKPGSTWSAVNMRRVEELRAEGRMTEAGLKAYEARVENRVGIYAYEQRSPTLETEYERRFRANERAWAFFESQPPSYRKTANWWVVSAKKPETRDRRLAQLIECSEAGVRIPQLRRDT
jgi:uncharacterized protein YdeI (YjbR/CyaY-like superfamily)